MPAPATVPRRARQLAAAIAGAVTLTIIIVALLVLSHGHPATGRRTGGGARPQESATSTPAATTGPPVIPVVGLGGLTWADFHGIELPASAQDGPANTSGGLASGFTDSPRGALLAAVNIGVRTAWQWGPAIFTPTIERQVTGPETSALLQAQQAAYAQAQAGPHPETIPVERAYAVEEAFRFDGYTPDDATVDVVSAGPGDNGATVRAATRIEVEWISADWRVVAPPGSDWGNAAIPLASLSGYTIFPGQG
ncbi:MAG: hypothetical protein ACRDNF_10895 [Streptosporangiaceae bacterium]